MAVEELADYIKEHKNGNIPYPYGKEFIIGRHVRSVLSEHIHITDLHILECCAKASTYEEFIELCRPLAKTDTEAFLREWNKAVPKGRTRRRFR
jgi:hypothetical protein